MAIAKLAFAPPENPKEEAGPVKAPVYGDKTQKNDVSRVALSLDVLEPYRSEKYNSEQYGIDPDELRLLGEHIRENGVLEPIQVKPLGGGRYMIISGHRRAQAARIAGLKTIPAIIKDVDEATADIIFHATNILNRAELTPMQKARGYQSLLDNLSASGSVSMRERFKDAEVSYRMVKRYASLLKLIEPLQKMTDELGVSVGSHLARLPKEKQEAVYRYVEAKGGTVKISERQAVALAESDAPDFNAVIAAILDPKTKQPVNFNKRVRDIMKKNDIHLTDDELWEVIERAVLAHKAREKEDAEG